MTFFKRWQNSKTLKRILKRFRTFWATKHFWSQKYWKLWLSCRIKPVMCWMRYDLPLEIQHTTFTARKCARKWLVGHVQIQQVAELTYWHQLTSRICALNFLQLTARCYTHHRNLFTGFLSPVPEKNPWDKGVANLCGPHVVLVSPQNRAKTPKEAHTGPNKGKPPLLLHTHFVHHWTPDGRDVAMGVDPRKNVEGTLASLVCPPVPLEIVPLKSS